MAVMSWAVWITRGACGEAGATGAAGGVGAASDVAGCGGRVCVEVPMTMHLYNWPGLAEAGSPRE